RGRRDCRESAAGGRLCRAVARGRVKGGAIRLPPGKRVRLRSHRAGEAHRRALPRHRAGMDVSRRPRSAPRAYALEAPYPDTACVESPMLGLGPAAVWAWIARGCGNLHAAVAM